MQDDPDPVKNSVFYLHSDHLGSVTLLTDYGLRITDYALRITHYALRITDYASRVTAQQRFLPYGGLLLADSRFAARCARSRRLKRRPLGGKTPRRNVADLIRENLEAIIPAMLETILMLALALSANAAKRRTIKEIQAGAQVVIFPYPPVLQWLMGIGSIGFLLSATLSTILPPDIPAWIPILFLTLGIVCTCLDLLNSRLSAVRGIELPYKRS